MKIKQLREYLNTLPEDLDNFDVVYAEAKPVVKEGEEFWSRLDNPVHSIVIDQDHEELVMGTMESIDTVIKMGDESEPVPAEIQTTTDGEPLGDGTYPAVWSGYSVEIRFSNKTYNFDTTKLGKGVRGMNIPATARIENGEITNIIASN